NKEENLKMRKSAKRFLSTILAMALLCSCMAVMNVSTVFAADSVSDLEAFEVPETFWADSITLDENGDAVTLSTSTLYYNNKIYTAGSKAMASSTEKGSYTDSNGDSHYYSLYLKQNSRVIAFKVPSACKITFYNNSHESRGLVVSTSTAVSYDDYSEAATAASSSSTILGVESVSTSSFSVYVTDASTIYVYSYGGDLFLAGFTIEDSSAVEYTITGECSGLADGDTFTLTDESDVPYGAEVSADDSSSTGYIYTASTTAEESPFDTSTTFTASKDNYSVTPDSVELTASDDDDYSFTGSDISFEQVFVDASVSNTAVTFPDNGFLTTDTTADVYAGSSTTANNVTIANGSAQLVDQGSGTTNLTINLTSGISSLTSGSVTFSGTVSDISNSGSKWSPITFRTSGGSTIAAIRSSAAADASDSEGLSGNYYSLAIPNGTNDSGTTYDYYETETSQKTATSFTYSITFDYDEDTISLTIGDKTVESDGLGDLESLSAVGQITAMTAGTSSREFTLGAITIKADVDYIYFGISEEQQSSSSSFSITANGETLVSNADTVYEGVILLDGTIVTDFSELEVITADDAAADYIVAYITTSKNSEVTPEISFTEAESE
ncbi:MAG: hypothetical protein LUC97_10575, partial [Clostridiales bacterium]|nr:hypothetical protein [Clostridiales bacterium]